MRKGDSWVTLVDGPIAELVDLVLAEHEGIAALVTTPGRRLAFRTFGAIRVGVVLGELLVDTDVEDGADWVEELAARPDVRPRLENELLAVAEGVAVDPQLAGDDTPEGDPRERFRLLIGEA